VCDNLPDEWDDNSDDIDYLAKIELPHIETKVSETANDFDVNSEWCHELHGSKEGNGGALHFYPKEFHALVEHDRFIKRFFLGRQSFEKLYKGIESGSPLRVTIERYTKNKKGNMEVEHSNTRLCV
jgi:hypothetical protein